jgi:hypothetical protein
MRSIRARHAGSWPITSNGIIDMSVAPPAPNDTVPLSTGHPVNAATVGDRPSRSSPDCVIPS